VEVAVTEVGEDCTNARLWTWVFVSVQGRLSGERLTDLDRQYRVCIDLPVQRATPVQQLRPDLHACPYCGVDFDRNVGRDRVALSADSAAGSGSVFTVIGDLWQC
jgi:hypothetical protein